MEGEPSTVSLSRTNLVPAKSTEFENSVYNSKFESSSSHHSSENDPYMTSSNWTEKFRSVV